MAVLDFEKLGSPTTQLRFSLFNIHITIQELVERSRVFLNRKAITLVCDVDKSVPQEIYLDKTKLVQVLSNLISNGFKFTQRGGQINLSVKVETDKKDDIEINMDVDGSNGDTSSSLATIYDQQQREQQQNQNCGDSNQRRKIRTISSDGKSSQKSRIEEQGRIGFLLRTDKKRVKRDKTTRSMKTMQNTVLVCSVRDNGPGLSESARKHIFEPYKQLSQNVHEFTGSGLGLSIAFRILQAFGGLLSVESVPGEGTCFTASFPLTEYPDSAPSSHTLVHNTSDNSLSSDMARQLVKDQFTGNQDNQIQISEGIQSDSFRATSTCPEQLQSTAETCDTHGEENYSFSIINSSKPHIQSSTTSNSNNLLQQISSSQGHVNKLIDSEVNSSDEVDEYSFSSDHPTYIIQEDLIQVAVLEDTRNHREEETQQPPRNRYDLNSNICGYNYLSNTFAAPLSMMVSNDGSALRSHHHDVSPSLDHLHSETPLLSSVQNHGFLDGHNDIHKTSNHGEDFRSMNGNKDDSNENVLLFLVVDDSEINRKILIRMLKRVLHGTFVIHEAVNGLEAFEKATENKYKMIFMDIVMPIMDGYESSLKIKQHDSEVVIVAASGNVMRTEESIEKLKVSGISEALGKPFTTSQIKCLLEKYNSVEL